MIATIRAGGAASLRAIARELNDRGVGAPTGGRWLFPDGGGERAALPQRVAHTAGRPEQVAKTVRIPIPTRAERNLGEAS